MKLYKFFTVCGLAVALVSCGGSEKKEKREIEPKTVEATLYGGEAISASSSCDIDPTEYLEIDTEKADKIEIKAEEEGYYIEAKTKVPIKILKQLGDMGSSFSIYLELLDEDNEHFTSLSPNSADKETLEKALKKGTPELVEVNFKSSISESEYDKLDKVKYYRIKDVYITTDSYSSSSSSDDDDVVSSSSSYSGSYYDDDDSDDDDDDGSVASSSKSSNNWDSLLDDFENYVDDLISIAKKVKAGDPSVMLEYNDVMKDAQKLSGQLAKAKGTMTSAQLSRYNKLVEKYSKAVK